MIYDGQSLVEEDVALCSVDPSDVLATRKSQDYASDVNKWAAIAATRDDILHFGILFHGELVGHIFFHDWDRETSTSLVGYHLFEPSMRGRGVGTKALHLLQRYAVESTNLRRLIAITTDDNLASRGVGRRAGFVEIGPSREDPEHGVVMEWLVKGPE